MLDCSNQLKVSFNRYQKYQVGRLCKDIPEDRRSSLVEELRARANILGCENKEALEAAIKYLGGKEK